MVKHVGKRGDTLIEVMLAVGIFSMVAVAVVAVMSGGTSSAQTTLETTLAREEIDAQAEALRFIQSSYIADKDNKDGKFTQLWQAIVEKAHNYDNPKKDFDATLAKYSPSECSNLYNATDGEARLHGFIINTQKLGTFTEPNEIIISGEQKREGTSEYILAEASTYPHLNFTDSHNDIRSDQQDLIDDTSYTKLYNAEGIYIIAVKDPKTTTIAGEEDQSAYYDFYIRTCWYGTGDQTPSTISTVIRLYDPAIVKDE